MKKSVLLISLFFLYTTVTGQSVKIVNPQQGTWLGYLNQTRFSTHWGLWVDLHHRRTDFADRTSQNLVRAGLTYFLADNLRLTAGYAYVGSHLSPSGIIRPEHRPWQQIWWTGRSGRLNLLQWVRAEQRYNHRINGDQLGDGYGFNWRLRYNIMLQIPLKGETIQPHVPNFVVQNEAFLNFGKQIVANTFDQNRFFVGMSYPFSKHLLGQLGYMNQFIQQPSGTVYVNNHTLRLFVFHTLDVRRQP